MEAPEKIRIYPGCDGEWHVTDERASKTETDLWYVHPNIHQALQSDLSAAQAEVKLLREVFEAAQCDKLDRQNTLLERSINQLDSLLVSGAGEWREFVPSVENPTREGDEELCPYSPGRLGKTWRSVTTIGLDTWVIRGMRYRRFHPAAKEYNSPSNLPQ